jgi:hypothetical protein
MRAKLPAQDAQLAIGALTKRESIWLVALLVNMWIQSLFCVLIVRQGFLVLTQRVAMIHLSLASLGPIRKKVNPSAQCARQESTALTQNWPLLNSIALKVLSHSVEPRLAHPARKTMNAQIM